MGCRKRCPVAVSAVVVVLRLRGGGCDTGATADGGPAVVLQVGCGCAAAALRRSAVQLYPGCVAAEEVKPSMLTFV